MEGWGGLPGLALRGIFQELSRQIAADALHSASSGGDASGGGAGALSVSAALAAAAAAAPNRHWRHVAQTELSLAVRCDGSAGQLHALLALAGRVRLTALHFCHAQDDGGAAAAVFELLSHGPFVAAVGPHLRALAGAPSASVAGGRREQAHPFPLAAFPALEALQLYVPPQLQVLSLRDGGAGWCGAAALRRLDIAGRHYVAVRALPPNLQRLSVSAWHVLLEPEAVARCERVEVRASAVLLSEHVLPYASLAGAATAVAARQNLMALAAVLAGAGLPPGHEVRLETGLVCFQAADDGADAKLVAPRAPAEQAGGGAPAFAPVAAAASGVAAMLAPAPGSALDMLVVLHGT